MGMATGNHLSGTETCLRRTINTRKKSKGLLALQNQGWFSNASDLQKAFLKSDIIVLIIENVHLLIENVHITQLWQGTKVEDGEYAV